MNSTNFLDQISESESQIIADEKTKTQSLSVPQIFQKSDFQLSRLSTASSLLSHLEVPNIFGRSSFMDKSPIFGSRFFSSWFCGDYYYKNCDTSLYDILCNSDEENVVCNLEEYLSKKFPPESPHTKKSTMMNPQDILPTNNSGKPLQRNADSMAQSLCSHKLDKAQINLLMKLKTYVELKIPLLCALLRFSSLKDDKTVALREDARSRELLSYILLYYWIVKENATNFQKALLLMTEEKSLYYLYTLFFQEFHVPAF